MLNNQGNHDRGHEQGNNNRGFGSQFGGAKGQGAFSLGGGCPLVQASAFLLEDSALNSVHHRWREFGGEAGGGVDKMCVKGFSSLVKHGLGRFRGAGRGALGVAGCG